MLAHVKTHNTVWLPWIILILIYLKSTNTIVHFDLRGGNLSLHLRERSTNICDVGWLFYLSHCQIRADDNSSTCALRQENLVDGTVVAIMLCLYVLITHCIFINFWMCWWFSLNVDVSRTLNNFIIPHRYKSVCD